MSDSSLNNLCDDAERAKRLYQLFLEWGMIDEIAKANAINIVYQCDLSPELFTVAMNDRP